MYNFWGGLLVGFLIGMMIAAIFLKEKVIQIKDLSDQKTKELLKLLELAEGENDEI